MTLLSQLLGNIISFGVIIIIIIFQPEIRNFLLILGNTTLKGRLRFLEQFFGENEIIQSDVEKTADKIVEAIGHLSNTKTGALIVLTHSEIPNITNSGHQLNAKVSSVLLENIFFKNAPLHDGAVIIIKDKVVAASCILPVSKTTKLDSDLGLRHRAAIGVTENTDLYSIIVSEQTGNISSARNGKLNSKLEQEQLKKEIIQYYSTKI